MAITNIKAEFTNGIEEVWNLVTSLDRYSWRSDVSKIEVMDNREKLVEYTKDGYSTTFTITDFEPYNRYEFDMENGNMKGHWTGIFYVVEGKTIVDFTENVVAKKLIMRPFVGGYLKKQQALYISDLKKVLS